MLALSGPLSNLGVCTRKFFGKQLDICKVVYQKHILLDHSRTFYFHNYAIVLCYSPEPHALRGLFVSGSLHCICRGGCKWLGMALGSTMPGANIFFPHACCCCCCCCLTGPGHVLVLVSCETNILLHVKTVNNSKVIFKIKQI